jgi:hypothetical protein
MNYLLALLGFCFCLIYQAETACAQEYSQSIWCISDSLALNLQQPTPQLGFSKSIRGLTEASIVNNNKTKIYLKPTINSSSVNGCFLNENNEEIGNSQMDWLQIATQPILLPMNGNKYFVITKQLASVAVAPDSLYYSIIDIAQNGGIGDMIVKDLALYPPKFIASGISVCKHADGERYWILAHEAENNRFVKFLLDQDTIQLHSTQDIGRSYLGMTVADNSYNARIGDLNFSVDGLSMVCSHGVPGILQLFDFNRCTGELTNFRDLSRSQPSPNQVEGAYYSVIFSRNKSIFYAVGFDTLYQFNIKIDTIIQSVIWYDTLNVTYNPLISGKYDFDYNRIFISTSPGNFSLPTVVDNYYLGVISNPDNLGTNCGFKKLGLYLNGKVSHHKFGPSINYGLGALGQAYAWPINGPKEPPPVCADDSVRLGEWFSEPGISYQWAPAAGLSCTTCFAPKAAPAQTTVYTLYTTSTNACGLTADTATVTVTILQPPSQVVINLGSDRTICAGDSLTIGVVPAPNVAYSWNTDATTASIGIRPEQTTTYILQAVDTSASCGEPVPAIDTLTVTVLPRTVLTATLPPDTAVCPGVSVLLTPTLKGTGSVLWSTGATTPSITVEPTATTTYTLTYSGTACDAPGTATVTVTVLPPDASPCRTTRPDETTAQIRIYPNPTTGPLTVSAPTSTCSTRLVRACCGWSTGRAPSTSTSPPIPTATTT